MADVLVEVGAFLFSLLLRNPFLLGRDRKTNVFSRTQTMFAETFPLLILDLLLLGLRRLHCFPLDDVGKIHFLKTNRRPFPEKGRIAQDGFLQQQP